MIWKLVNSHYFQKWNWSWKDAGVIPMRISRPNRESVWHSDRQVLPGSAPKIEESVGQVSTCGGGTTSMLMAADRPYGESDDFYSVRPEYFGCVLVDICNYYGLESFLRSLKFLSIYIRFLQIMKDEVSLPCSQQPTSISVSVYHTVLEGMPNSFVNVIYWRVL
jgi:hypothetical protein